VKAHTPIESSRAQEEHVAQVLGGRRQPGSGNRAGYRGDVAHAVFYIECKETSKESIRLEGHWLATAAERAQGCDQVPLLAVRLDCLRPAWRDWALVPLQFLADLLAEREGR